jgi:hypothetical protein
MGIRKYLFWKNKDGIRTYKVTQNETFDLMKPSGRDVFTDGEWASFFTWFHKNAAITEDEFIDFCFLSEDTMEFPLLEYNPSFKSSWDKQEINLFCNRYICSDTYEVYYSEDKSFIYQSGNVFDKKKVKKLFLKCIPEFSIELEEEMKVCSDETSLINRFYIDRLNELDDN